jgi:hypothetical protein
MVERSCPSACVQPVQIMSSFVLNDDLDPRLTPAREDLAASWLKGKVTAAHYIEPTRRQIGVGIVNLYRTPDTKQAIETQLLMGEPVDVFDSKDGWAWVQSARDGYVGYLPVDALDMKPGDRDPTHRVANIGAFVFPKPNDKDTPLLTLSYGSLVRVVKEKDGMCELASGGFVPSPLLSVIDFHAEEPVAEAFRFLGAPYLWGGRSHIGLDCSALVQLVLLACNIKCPRDSDLQEKFLGKPIDRDQVRGGDLAFFRGHVGLMVDDTMMIHANDRAMAVSIDDLDEYTQWRAKNGKTPVKLFKRIG